MAQQWVFFKGRIVPDDDAKISVRTHAFNYGTGVFEGIRAFWDEARQRLVIVALRQHYERLINSGKILRIAIPYTVEELVQITLGLLEREAPTADTYIRPIAYKSDEKVGVNLKGGDGFCIYTTPFGSYYPDETNVKAVVVSRERVADNAIPARGKINGSYVNPALSKDDAQSLGMDEAIVLTQDGHVSEASAANLFIVRHGQIITPPVTADILEGITRQIVMLLVQHQLHTSVLERQIDRTELYVADEVFICGTACNVSAITSVDNRLVGFGRLGPLTRVIRDAYIDFVHGEWRDHHLTDEYITFFTPSATPAR